MAISRDTVTSGITAGTTLTISSTLSASNGGIFVAVLDFTAAGIGNLINVTYNGNNINFIGYTAATTAGPGTLSLWQSYSDTVGSGTHNVVVTRTSGAGGALVAAVVPYQGARQSFTMDDFQTGSAIAAAGLTINGTSVHNNCWGIMAVITSNGNSNASTNSFNIFDNQFQLYDTNGPLTPAGSFGMSVTEGGSPDFKGAMVFFPPVLSTADNIITFDIGVNSGVIVGTNITVTVPYGTNVTSLTPTITVSAGATVSPASGIAKDFTSPVTYTVTAEDGTTTKAYTVTVVVTPSLLVGQVIII